jgi:hypothetical protein
MTRTEPEVLIRVSQNMKWNMKFYKKMWIIFFRSSKKFEMRKQIVKLVQLSKYINVMSSIIKLRPTAG